MIDLTTHPRRTAIVDGLAFLHSLPVKEQRAFLGLFAGARLTWTSFNGEQPSMGKAECEWVDNWREFYSQTLPEGGLLEFTESEPSPALGMAPGSTFTKIIVRPTLIGHDVREAWWDALNARTSAT